MVVFLAMAFGAGCVWNARSPERPTEGTDAIILLESTVMPQPIRPIARHSFFLVRKPATGTWESIELGYVQRNDVRLHATWRGAAAERGIACLQANAPALDSE